MRLLVNRSVVRSGATLPIAVVLAVAVAATLRRVEVVGASMAPTLLPGDRLLVVRWLPHPPGSIVAVPDPRRPERLLVKRVRAVGPAGVEVRGDAEAASTDSRHFGPVPARSVIGRAVWRYAPADRSGRLQ